MKKNDQNIIYFNLYSLNNTRFNIFSSGIVIKDYVYDYKELKLLLLFILRMPITVFVYELFWKVGLFR